MEQVVLGLSGGVDSAVSARLLRETGLAVHGLYLDIGTEKEREDAAATAEFLRIPLEIRDIRRELEACVCAPFAAAYLRGETPNPCVLCNPAVKFKNLCAMADELGARYVATGHYARAEQGSIYMGRSENDQSYMLCRLRREQAARLLLPLGGYCKTEVRAMAEGFGIPVARKPDSMEICFIRDKDYIGWLSRRAAVPGPGDFVFHGAVLGRHEGIHRYTVGQRWKGLYQERKLYIGAIRPETNEIELVLWEELFRTEFHVRDVSWLIDAPASPLTGRVRVRHTKWETPGCTVYPEGSGARIVTDEPVRAPARGQAAAIYDGERLLGGGIIL
ncbi:MAG: tRNA 2-thiouridine(34) synthase MnmA [Oscillospiraceae bacterium]|nr:tRNA 2-thiouridine(34) synthase MnmA [Oscillospiraceae bacterium]